MKRRKASSCRPSCSLSMPSVQYRTTRFCGSIVFAKIPPVHWATCSSSFKVFFVRPWCAHRNHFIMLFHPGEGTGRDGEIPGQIRTLTTAFAWPMISPFPGRPKPQTYNHHRGTSYEEDSPLVGGDHRASVRRLGLQGQLGARQEGKEHSEGAGRSRVL